MRLLVAGYRVALAGVGVAAVGVQLAHTGDVGHFFSFFTIQSNIIAIAVLGYGVFGRVPDSVRGAAVTYMAITGIVYAALLSGLPAAADSTIGWVNVVLHDVMPIAMALDWLLVPPTTRLRFGRSLVWLLYPLAYGAYTLIRGAVVHWYPYPFLDAGVHGYGRVAVNCAAFAVAAVALIRLVVFLGNLMRPDRITARAHA